MPLDPDNSKLNAVIQPPDFQTNDGGKVLYELPSSSLKKNDDD